MPPTRMRLSMYRYGTSRPIIRSLLLTSDSALQIRTFMQCSAIHQNLKSQTDALPIRRTRGGTYRVADGGVRRVAGEGPQDTTERSKQVPQSSNGQFKESFNILYTSAGHVRPNPRDSGYGWTAVVKQGQLTSSAEHVLRVIPFSMLWPYETPLLVVLMSSQAVGIEEQLKETAFRILTKLYRPADGSTIELHLLSVFVDKVSVPASSVKVIPKSKVSDGTHGYSFWWTSRDMLQTPSSIAPSQDRIQPQGSLTVHINHLLPKGSEGLPAFSRFRIPLVNTTFTTGRDYTMHLQSMTWKGVTLRTDGSWSFDSYLVENIQHLGNQNATLGINSSRELLVPQIYSHTRVSILTPWRVVTNVSGNVVKSVEGSEGPLPASTELETAIAKLASNEYGQFEVWAEIRSGSVDIPNKRAANHGRCVKVISGGGGWGEKRGLIALDPGPIVESLSTVQQDLSDELDFTKLLPNILEVGDKLRFLKFPIDRVDHGETEVETPVRTLPEVYIERGGQTTFGFGTTGSLELESSSATDHPEPHVHDSNSYALLEQAIFGHFGAMTQRMHHEYAYGNPTTKDETNPTVVQHSYATNLPPFSYIGDGRHFIAISTPTASLTTQRTATQSPKDDQEPPATTTSKDSPSKPDPEPLSTESPTSTSPR